MKVNKLLQTQLRRHLPPGFAAQENIQEFLQEISNTYSLYQQELAAATKGDEAPLQAPAPPPPVMMPVTRKEKPAATPEQAAADGSSDFLLTKGANRLIHLFNSLNNGILLEDEHGRVILANQLFCDSLQVAAAPEALVGLKSEQLSQVSKQLFKDPYEYITRIDLVIAAKKMVVGDELEMADGRVFLRDYIPLFIDNEYYGHLWKFEDITRERENRETLRRLSLVASANENGVAFSDASGAVLWANDGFINLTGYSHEEILGKNALQLGKGPLTDRDTLSKMVDSFIAGKSFTLEVLYYRKDESSFWGRIKGQPLLDAAGNVVQYFAIVEDITLEKEQEEQLKVLSLIAEENLNAVTIMDARGQITWVNKSFIKTTGYTLEEVQGRQAGSLLYGEATSDDTIQYLRGCINDGTSFNCEMLNYKKDGTTCWLRIQGQPLRNKAGVLTGFFSLEEDITLHIEQGTMMQEYESRFRKAFETIGDNVWEHDFSSNQTYFSNTKSHLLGYELDEFTNNKKLWWDRTHKDDAHLIWSNDAKYRNCEIDHHILEYRVLHKDGTIRWVMDRGVVIQRDERNQPLKIIGTHTDITERKQAEEILQTKEEKYRSIIANMNLGLMEVDIEEKIVFTNQSFCDMSGYDHEELIGERASKIFVKAENMELMESKNEARKKGASDAYEIAVKDKRGQLRWWLVSGATRYNESGDLVGSIGIYLDITDQKQLEIDLIEAREQAEVGSPGTELEFAL